MNTGRLACHMLMIGALVLAMTMADVQQGPARAQGKLEASYAVTLAGLSVGHGEWVIDIGQDRFSINASGATAGILRVFFGDHVQIAARGAVSGGHLVSSTYASSIKTDKEYDDVHIVISGGTVKEFSAEPPDTPDPSRVPLTEAHRRGVADPVTAFLIRVPGNGEMVAPQVCQRNLSIFDGRMRYDLALSFKRFEAVRSQVGYEGSVVVCAVRFSPIAGYVPSDYALKYIADSRDMEMWFAPISGTRIMAPYRVSVPTLVAVGVLQATQFVSTAQPGRTTAKTQ